MCIQYLVIQACYISSFNFLFLKECNTLFQTCEIQFVPTGHAPFEISFIALHDKVDTSLFSENGVWELMDTHVSAGVAQHDIQYLIATFHIKRRASFYLVNMLLPISTMSILNLLVFL